jgi:hypothetical protein
MERAGAPIVQLRIRCDNPKHRTAPLLGNQWSFNNLEIGRAIGSAAKKSTTSMCLGRVRGDKFEFDFRDQQEIRCPSLWLGYQWSEEPIVGIEHIYPSLPQCPSQRRTLRCISGFRWERPESRPIRFAIITAMSESIPRICSFFKKAQTTGDTEGICWLLAVGQVLSYAIEKARLGDMSNSNNISVVKDDQADPVNLRISSEERLDGRQWCRV